MKRPEHAQADKASIIRIPDAHTTVMTDERGITRHLVGPSVGAVKVDVHINTLNQDSGTGPYHYHARAENVYVVLDGVVEAIIDHQRYFLVKDDVVFIPRGVPHAAGSAGFGSATVLEIYAPVGHDFHVLDDPGEVMTVARPEIEHLLPCGLVTCE